MFTEPIYSTCVRPYVSVSFIQQYIFDKTSLKSSAPYLGWCAFVSKYISRTRNRFSVSLRLLAFVRRLSHNSDVTASSSHLAERFQHWLGLTAVWPASCLTIMGKHSETGSKHGLIHLLTQPGQRGQRQQGEKAELQRERRVS